MESISVTMAMKNCRLFLNSCNFVKKRSYNNPFDLVLKYYACTLTVVNLFFSKMALHRVADGKLKTRFSRKL